MIINTTNSTRQGGRIGSDAWLGDDEFAHDDQFGVETAKFFGEVKWHVLARIPSCCRSGITCSYTEKYSIG